MRYKKICHRFDCLNKKKDLFYSLIMNHERVKKIETNPEKQTKKSRSRRYIAAAVKLILAAIVIYFAGRQLVNNWAEISQYKWEINLPMIILSIVLHLITFVFFSGMWCILIRAFGHKIPFKYAFKVSYIADMGRYIPGKIWPVVGMIYLLKRIGINKETAFASWGIATIIGLPPGFMVGFIAFLIYPEMLSGVSDAFSGIGPIIAIIIIIGGSVILVLTPDRPKILLNCILRLLKRPQVDFNLEKRVAAGIYLGYFIGWVFYGLGFYTFINAIGVGQDLPLIAGVGSFVLAYIIGYLTFFSPGGIGSRELVLTTVLSPFLGLIAAGVVVAARVWNIVCEIIAALIALSIKMGGKRT